MVTVEIRKAYNQLRDALLTAEKAFADVAPVTDAINDVNTFPIYSLSWKDDPASDCPFVLKLECVAGPERSIEHKLFLEFLEKVQSIRNAKYLQLAAIVEDFITPNPTTDGKS
jgi:hypothetical protein